VNGLEYGHEGLHLDDPHPLSVPPAQQLVLASAELGGEVFEVGLDREAILYVLVLITQVIREGKSHMKVTPRSIFGAILPPSYVPWWLYPIAMRHRS
jgi:hypothetical protein